MKKHAKTYMAFLMISSTFCMVAGLLLREYILMAYSVWSTLMLIAVILLVGERK